MLQERLPLHILEEKVARRPETASEKMVEFHLSSPKFITKQKSNHHKRVNDRKRRHWKHTEALVLLLQLGWWWRFEWDFILLFLTRVCTQQKRWMIYCAEFTSLYETKGTARHVQWEKLVKRKERKEVRVFFCFTFIYLLRRTWTNFKSHDSFRSSKLYPIHYEQPAIENILTWDGYSERLEINVIQTKGTI